MNNAYSEASLIQIQTWVDKGRSYVGVTSMKRTQ